MITQRSIKPVTELNELYGYAGLSSCTISPDGSSVLFVVQRVDEKSEKKYSDIWISPASAVKNRRKNSLWPAGAKRFTSGDWVDRSPQWSPDGNNIAFLSNRANPERFDLFVIPSNGGEAISLTSKKGDFSSFKWSPCGTLIAASFRNQAPEDALLDNDESRKKLGRVSYVYKDSDFKMDGQGMLPSTHYHIILINASMGKVVQVTPESNKDQLEPCFSPDGSLLAWKANTSEKPDLEHENDDIFFLPMPSAKLTIDSIFDKTDNFGITDALGEAFPAGLKPCAKSNIAFSPDGQWLSFTAKDSLASWWKNDCFWAAPLKLKTTKKSGRGRPSREDRLKMIPKIGKPVNITGKVDITINHFTLTDAGVMEIAPPLWCPDSRSVILQMANHGRVSLYRFSVPGKTHEIILDVPGCIGSYSIDDSGKKLSYLYSSFLSAGQVWSMKVDTSKAVKSGKTRGRKPRKATIDKSSASSLLSNSSTKMIKRNADGAEYASTQKLSDIFDDFQMPGECLKSFECNEPGKVEAAQIEEVWVKGPDNNKIQGWIMYPADFDGRRKYPSILQIHGGPLAQYGNNFVHEFNYLCGLGYVVYFCNPRGGIGYGEQHAGAIWKNWGSADYADIMAFTDFVSKRRWCDTNKMGVTGGSYGGYMTNWIIGHTDRFNSAVTQRCVSNLISLYGASDMNWILEEEIAETPPWDDYETYWNQSPMKYAGNFKTPTMVIHSENDLRCGMEQGEQMFVALRRMGVPTEMVRFPGEFHGLSRGGRTDRRIERLRHIARWFNLYLKGIDENQLLEDDNPAMTKTAEISSIETEASIRENDTEVIILSTSTIKAAPKRRGRPPKKAVDSSGSVKAAPKRRGRPPKKAVDSSSSVKAAPKRRGRPPKVKTAKKK